jgi:hypothetical protein
MYAITGITAKVGGELARNLLAVASSFVPSCVTQSKPRYYAVSSDDRTINPHLERFMAKRVEAKTIEVKASHLSLISHPDEITRQIPRSRGTASLKS